MTMQRKQLEREDIIIPLSSIKYSGNEALPGVILDFHWYLGHPTQ